MNIMFCFMCGVISAYFLIRTHFMTKEYLTRIKAEEVKLRTFRMLENIATEEFLL